MSVLEKYRRHIPLAIGVSLVLIAYPAVHPVIGAFGFIMSLVVSVMSSVLLSMASDASFTRTQPTSERTDDDVSLAEAMSRLNDELDQMDEDLDRDDIQQAYVDGDIDEVEFEQLIEDELEDDVELDADGRLRRVPEDTDVEDERRMAAISKRLRPHKSKVSETPERDPRE